MVKRVTTNLPIKNVSKQLVQNRPFLGDVWGVYSNLPTTPELNVHPNAFSIHRNKPGLLVLVVWLIHNTTDVEDSFLATLSELQS